MKILLFSDLHCSSKALKFLEELLSKEKFDLVVSPGDIVDRYDPQGEEYVTRLCDLCKSRGVTIKVVFGNNDPENVISLYEKIGISLHNKSYKQGGYTFVGIGDIETHPDRIFNPTELPIAGNILVTHRPPSKISNFKPQISNFKNAPAIHIAGHIHIMAFTEKIGKTLVIHVPSAQNERAAILKLPKKAVQFI